MAPLMEDHVHERSRDERLVQSDPPALHTGQQLEPDHEPRVYPDDRYSSNTWGPLPPRSYFRFDPLAVEWERESREMLGEPLPPAETVVR